PAAPRAFGEDAPPAKPEEPKPADPKPADPKPTDPKPDDPKPGDGEKKPDDGDKKPDRTRVKGYVGVGWAPAQTLSAEERKEFKKETGLVIFHVMLDGPAMKAG